MSKSSAIDLVGILTLFHSSLGRKLWYTEIYYARAIMKPIYHGKCEGDGKSVQIFFN